MNPHRVSIVSCAFNEELCVTEFCARIKAEIAKHPLYDWEIILVENGSSDRTWDLMKNESDSDRRFRLLRLSRNFGFDGGLTAGLKFATGDAAILMAADLQDPPELISTFLKLWEQGYENVFMEVSERQGTGLMRRLNSRLFYKLAARLTGGQYPENVSDYRLVDRKVYESVRDLTERNRFLRGLFGWVGFRSIGVKAVRPPRYGGSSNANTLRVLDLAVKGILAHSYIPLKMITFTGLILSFISLMSIGVLSVLWILTSVPFAGFGTLLSTILFVFSTLTFMLGIIAEYIGLIYEETKGRPVFLVSETIGF